VRHFLAQMSEHLLTHQLGRNETLLLVGDLLFGVVLRPLGQRGDDAFQQTRQTVASRGRDYVACGTRGQCGVGQALFFTAGRSHQVELVQGQKQRHGRAQRRQDLGHLPILGRGRLGQIDQPQHYIGIGDRPRGRLDHDLAQPVLRRVDARRIHKDNLSVAPCQDTEEPVTGRLRPRGDDRDLLADQRVDQC
jgi:hypothetical protein